MAAKSGIVDRPVLVTVVFSLLVILGALLALRLSVALFPEINPPVVVVSTTYGGAGPTTVEKTVTKVIESTLVNVSSLKKMTSTSSENISTVILQFDYGYNLDTATNDIRDKLGIITSQLPTGAGTPRVFRFDPNSQPILQIALRGDRSAEELRQLAEDLVQDPLQRVSGVAEASVSGGRAQVVRVDVAQNRLDAYNLTLSSIKTALAGQNLELGGGRITEGERNYSVRTVGEFKTVSEIARTQVAVRNGQGVTLADVATVKLGYKDETSAVFINGVPGIYVAVQKQSGGNTVQIADNVKKALPAIQKSLPPDVVLEVVADDTTLIRQTVDTLLRAATEAVIFAMLVIFLFLRSAKTTFIIGLSIPISIGITLMAMTFLGLTLNIFTMTGLILGVGMIVDDSIVIMENIVRYRERGMKNRIAAIIGSQEMRSAVLASTLTTVFVFLPIVLFKNQLGIIGILFQDMVFTIVISLMASLAVALFLVPVLTSKYFPLVNRHETPLANPLVRWADGVLAGAYQLIEDGYRWLLTRALGHKTITVLLVAIAFFGSLTLASTLKVVFVPAMAEDSVTLNVELPVGTALPVTKEVLRQFEEIVKAEAHGVKTVISTAGGASSSLSASQAQTGSLKIILPPAAERQDSADRLKEILRSHYGDFPSATFSFAGALGSQLSGATAPVDLVVTSDSLEAASATAHSLVDLIKTKVPEATEVKMDLNEGLPQVEVQVDRRRAAALGINISQVATEVQASIDGTVATQFHADSGDYDILVILRPQDRQKVLDLNQIYLTNSQGIRVALANFATVDKGTGPVSVKHQNKARTIHVTANLAPGATPGAVTEKIRTLAQETLVFDQVQVAFEGDQSALADTAKTMGIVLILALLLVFGVMAGQYESFKNPLINLLTVPLMVIGVLVIHFVTGAAFNMMSAVGVVMLVGLVVKNGIVMIDYTSLLQDRGLHPAQAALEAGVARLRPVLMTSLTAILGMIPLAFGHGEGGELVQPIGLTVIGGLTSATLITLFLIPVLYSAFNRPKTVPAPEVTHAQA